MKVVILIISLFLCVNSYGLSDLKCLIKGNIYWCKTIKTANQCNKIATCLHEWKINNDKIQYKSSDICQSCESVIYDISMLVKSKHSEIVIRNIGKELCPLISQTKQVKNMCWNLTDEKLKMVIEMIQDEKQPAKICHLSEYCPSKSDHHVKSVFGVFSLVLSQSNLKKHTAVGIIEEMGDLDKNVCEVCKSESLKLVKWMRTTENKSIVKQTFQENICPTKDCLNIIDSVMKYIESDDTIPEAMCNVFLHCDTKPSHQFAMLLKKEKIVSQEPSPSERAPRTSESLNRRLTLNDDIGSEMSCEICRLAVIKIENFVASNTTKIGFNHFLQKLCHLLPQQYETRCLANTDRYDHLIENLAAKASDPNIICELMTLCPITDYKTDFHRSRLSKSFDNKNIKSTTPETKTQFEILMPELIPEQQHTDQNIAHHNSPDHSQFSTTLKCVLCKGILKEIETVLTSNQADLEMEKLVDHVCRLFPINYYNECEEIVRKNIPDVIKLVVSKVPPNLICQKIELC